MVPRWNFKMQKLNWYSHKLKHVSKVNAKIEPNFLEILFFQKLKHGSKVKFQNEKIKRIFSKIKTWFEGEIFKK
jgi:hypothetical protein